MGALEDFLKRHGYKAETQADNENEESGKLDDFYSRHNYDPNKNTKTTESPTASANVENRELNAFYSRHNYDPNKDTTITAAQGNPAQPTAVLPGVVKPSQLRNGVLTESTDGGKNAVRVVPDVPVRPQPEKPKTEHEARMEGRLYEQTHQTDAKYYTDKIDYALSQGAYQSAIDWMEKMTRAPLTDESRQAAQDYINTIYENRETWGPSAKTAVDDAVDKILYAYDRGADIFANLMTSEEGQALAKTIEKAYGVKYDTAAMQDPTEYVKALQGGSDAGAFWTFVNGQKGYLAQNAYTDFEQRAFSEMEKAGKSPTTSAQMDSYIRAQTAYTLLDKLYNYLDVGGNTPVNFKDATAQYIVRDLKTMGVDLTGATEETYREAITKAMEEQSEKARIMGNVLRQEGFNIDAVREYTQYQWDVTYEQDRMRSADTWAKNAGIDKLAASMASWAEHTWLSGYSTLGTYAKLLGYAKDDDDPNKAVPAAGTVSNADLVQYSIGRNTNGVDAFLYGVGSSMIESLLRNASFGAYNRMFHWEEVPKGLIRTLTLSQMGVNVAGSTANQILQRGGNASQAMAGGLASGAIEAITEVASLEVVLDKLRNVETFKGWLWGIGFNMLAEGSEEGASNILNLIVDAANMGNLSEQSQAIQQLLNEGKTLEEAQAIVLNENLMSLVMDVAAGAASGGGEGLIVGGVSYAKAGIEKAYYNRTDKNGNYKHLLYFSEQQQKDADEAAKAMYNYSFRYLTGDEKLLQTLYGMSEEDAKKAALQYERIQREYRQITGEVFGEENSAADTDATEETPVQAQEMPTQPQTEQTVELPVDRNTFTPDTAAEDAQSVVEAHRQMERDGTLQNRAAAEELLKTAETATVHVQNAEATGRLTAQQAYDSELALRQVIESAKTVLAQNNTPAQTTAPVQNIEIGGMDNGRTEGITDGAQRNEGVGADQQGRAVAEGTGARAERGRTASLEVRRALAAGEFDLRSPKEAGIKGGSQSQTMQILRDSAVERIDELRQIRNEAAKDGLNVVFFGGTCEVYNKYAKGNKIKPEGINDPDTNTVYLKVDKMNRTAAQLYDHEMMHKMLRENPEMRGYLANLLAQAYTPEGLDRLIAQYCEAYRWCYGKFTESMTEDEYNELYDMYLDELLADAYALIRRGDINTVKAEQAMAAFRSDRTDSGKENAAAIERTNGPGENKTAGTEDGGVQRYSAEEYDPESAGIKEQIANSVDTLNAVEIVASASVPENLNTNREAAKWATEILKKYGYRVDREGFGEVYFSKNNITSALRYTVTNEERAALAVLPQVIKRGIEIGSHDNHKGRTKKTVTFAAPVSLNGIRGNMAVVINKNGNHYYAHRIMMPDGTMFRFSDKKTDATQEGHQGVTENGSLADATSAASKYSLADDNADVKQRFSIDDDAEYLSLAEKYRDGTASEEETAELQRAVEQAASAAGFTEHLYHGTGAFGFTAFDMKSMDDGASIFLTNDSQIASTYSGVTGSREIRAAADIPENISPVIVASELNAFMPDQEKDNGYSYMYMNRETGLQDLIEQNEMRLLELRDYILYKADLPTNHEGYMRHVNELVKEIESGYNPESNNISTPLYILAEHAGLFDEKTKALALDTESKVRLASMFLKSDMQEAIVKTGLGGYDVEIYTVEEARETLAKASKQGNYSLYSNLGKTYTVNAEGKLWNNLRENVDVSQFNTVIAGAHGYRIYNTFSERTFYPADNATGEFETREEAEKWLSEHRENEKVTLSKTRDVSRWARLSGYDSVVFKGIKDNGGRNANVEMDKKADIYALFKPSQAKSADLVTYDDEGNIIPLSERFRTDRTGEDEWKNDDIRYSVEDDAAELDEEYKRAVQRDAAEDEPTEKGRSFLPQRDAALGPDYAAVATEEIERRAKEASLKELRQMLKTSEAELNKYRWAKRKGILPDELAERMKTVEDTVKIQNEELKHKNADERKQREKRKEEEAKQQQPRIAKKELKATIEEIFSVPANSRKAMNDLIETAANKIIQQGYISSEDKTALRDALLRSGVVNIAPEGYYGEIRSYVQQGRIYVPESVREEFGDDWADFRKRAWGNRIYLTSDTTDRPIDDWNQDLAQMFPGGFEEGATDMKEALEQIVALAEEGSAENITIAEMMERNKDNYGWSVETQMEQLEEQFDAALKSFAEKANVEIKARQEKATEVLKERRRMREMIERESARRHESEQRNRVMKSIQQLNRMRNRTAPEVKAQINEVLNGIDTVARSISDRGLENLIELAKAYEQAKADNPNFIPNPYVEARLARLQQTQLDDMEIGDVIELGRTVSALVKSVQDANKLMSEEYKAEIDATARDFVKEMQATKGSKGGKLYQWAVENHLSPVRMIRHLGGWAEGGASAQIAQSLENGQTRQMRYLMEASHIFDKFLASKENKTWLEKASGKNAEWIKVSVPVNYGVNENDQTEIKWQDIEITPMMRVALYMHSLNFDNLRHIMGGGMTIPNRAYYEKGDMQNAYAYGTRVKMTPETVRAIVKDMTEQERTFAGLLREYYDRYSKDHINEVSMILDGFERAGGENYYHIKTDQNFLSKLPDNIQKNISLESIGSIVNERVFSKVPIVLEDASVSLADHIQQISKYYGFAVPIHDFTAIMNFTDHETGNIFSGSVRELMGQQWGAGAQKYLNKLMEDLQSSSGINEMTATFLRNLRGKLAGASLMFNPAVALSQTASYPGAMQTLGARALAEGLKLWERVDTSLIEKYSPLLWYRNQGNSTQELGDYMDGQTLEHKLPGLLGWIQKMDSATVRRLWAASEYYVKNNTDLRPGSEAEIAAGTDEYYQKVAEMFNRAVYDTQPNYSTMQRPQILRSNSDLTKFLTMFKTVPLQYYNMMFEAAGRLSNAKQRGNAEEIKSAAGYFARTAVGLVTANAFYVFVKSMFKVFKHRDKKYRDEEGNWDWGEYFKQFGLDVADTFAGGLIGGAELLDAVERIVAAVGGEKQRYNGVDINAISFLSSIVQDVLDLSSAIGELDGKDLASAIKGILKDGVMGTLGLPAENAETYLLALTKWISPETAERYENLFSDRGKSSLSEEHGRYLAAAISVYMDNRTEDLPDEVKQELQRLWEAGQKNAIPSAVPSSVTVGGESIALTSSQKAQYREKWSRIVSDNLEALIGTEYYQDADETTQGKMIDRLYRYASEVAKENLGIDYTAENWAASAETDGLPEYLTYCALRSMMDRQADEATNTAAVAAVMDYVIGGISEDDSAEIARLYMGGAEGLIPQTAPTSFTYKDENGVEHAAELDAEARAKYAETYRNAIGDQLTALMSSPEYADADDKGRAALIGKVFDFAAGVAKAEVAEGYTPDKWILNGFEDMDDGIQLADYIVYHTGYTRLNGKNEDGESESGLKDRRTLDLIDGNDWTDDQKISVYLDDCSNAAAGKVKAMDAAGFSWKQIKTVLTADKQEIAVLQANVSDSAKLKVLEIYCNEKQMAKYQVGYQFGVRFKDYAEVMQNANTDGKGSITQDEATDYIKSMALSAQDSAYLWQMVTDGKNGKNNPFSPTFGAEFYYEMHKND